MTSLSAKPYLHPPFDEVNTIMGPLQNPAQPPILREQVKCARVVAKLLPRVVRHLRAHPPAPSPFSTVWLHVDGQRQMAWYLAWMGPPGHETAGSQTRYYLLHDGQLAIRANDSLHVTRWEYEAKVLTAPIYELDGPLLTEFLSQLRLYLPPHKRWPWWCFLGRFMKGTHREF